MSTLNPLSPMPPDVVEELATWKDGRREEPWADAHQREAFVRLCELAIEMRREGPDGAVYAGDFAYDAMNDDGDTEALFRLSLAAHFVEARIEHEVAIVRQRAERPTPTLSRVSADDELRREIAVDVGSLYDQHDLVTGACFIALKKYRQELADGVGFERDLRAVITDLRDIAIGKTTHVYRGACPEERFAGNGDERAYGCPACDVLRRADALLDGAVDDGLTVREQCALIADKHVRVAGGYCSVAEQIAAEIRGADAEPPSWTQRALDRLMADPAAVARFNAARLSPEAANMIAACRKREGMQEAFEACLRAWKDDVDRKAPPVTATGQERGLSYDDDAWVRGITERCEAGWERFGNDTVSRLLVLLDAVRPATPLTAGAWTPPPDTTVEMLHGSLDAPFLVALVTLEPGAEWPREVHAEHEEEIVLVHGCANADRGGLLWLLDESDPSISVPAGMAHTIRNGSGSGQATYISILRRVAPTGDR